MYRYKSNHAKLANRELLLQVLATRGRQLTRPKVREKLLSGTRELFPCSRSVEVEPALRLPSQYHSEKNTQFTPIIFRQHRLPVPILGHTCRTYNNQYRIYPHPPDA
jgi:hypothetical protein